MDFDQLEVKETGIADNIRLQYSQREEDFALRFKGFITILRDGVYTFYIDSDDGSKLFIGNELIVDNDFIHGMVEKSGEIALQTGNHPIIVSYFQGAGGLGLNVSYKGPGISKQKMPSEVLYHKEK